MLVAALSVLFGCDDGVEFTGCDNAACDMHDDSGGCSDDSEGLTHDAEPVSDVALPGTANVDPAFEFPSSQLVDSFNLNNPSNETLVRPRHSTALHSAFGSDYALF